MEPSSNPYTAPQVVNPRRKRISMDHFVSFSLVWTLLCAYVGKEVNDSLQPVAGGGMADFVRIYVIDWRVILAGVAIWVSGFWVIRLLSLRNVNHEGEPLTGAEQR